MKKAVHFNIIKVWLFLNPLLEPTPRTAQACPQDAPLRLRPSGYGGQAAPSPSRQSHAQADALSLDNLSLFTQALDFPFGINRTFPEGIRIL